VHVGSHDHDASYAPNWYVGANACCKSVATIILVSGGTDSLRVCRPKSYPLLEQQVLAREPLITVRLTRNTGSQSEKGSDANLPIVGLFDGLLGSFCK
jgi:hypothetical protein